MGQEAVVGTGGPGPGLNKPRFECPHCVAFAAMDWSAVYSPSPSGGITNLGKWSRATCASCNESSLWLSDKLVYPGVRLGPPPNQDMPANVKELYEEARTVSTSSPRSAAGLLRLGLQVLADNLVEGNGSINDKIGALVKKGLSPVVQQAMDTVRVAGNNALHPGTLQLHDDPEQLATLFALVNLIVDQMIRQPRLVGEMYSQLPAGAVAAVERRDNGA